jgi:hypothetical protein
MDEKRMSQCQLDALTRRGFTYFALGDTRRANVAVFAIYCGMVAEWTLEKAREEAKKKRDAEMKKAIASFTLPSEIARQIVANKEKYPLVNLVGLNLIPPPKASE